MDFSKRTGHIDVSGIRRMFELAKGEDIINLGLGEPDFPIPEESKKAVIDALKEDLTHYTPGKGLPELRDGIAVKLRLQGISASPEEIIVTSGASEALEIALLALVDEGDEVLVPDPGFVSYHPLTRIAGGVPKPYSLREEEGFKIDINHMESQISDKTKAIILNTPSNPTGVVASKKEIKEIADLAENHSIPVVSDEVYDEIIYEGEHHGIARYTDLAVTVNSFSKTYSMTGLRLGYLQASERMVDEIFKIHQYVQASTCSLSQAAAIAALNEGGSYNKEMVKELKVRRQMAVSLLSEVEGLSFVKPTGAFYIFPDISAHGSSEELAMEFLREARVAVTPGNAFGENGQGNVRLSFATSREKVTEGIERIYKYLKRKG